MRWAASGKDEPIEPTNPVACERYTTWDKMTASSRSFEVLWTTEILLWTSLNSFFWVFFLQVRDYIRLQQGGKSVPKEAFQRDMMIHEEHRFSEPKALKAKVKWEMDISETFDDIFFWKTGCLIHMLRTRWMPKAVLSVLGFVRPALTAAN